MANEIAPYDCLFVCLACGKTSEDKYGMEGRHDSGWDESCMLNCELFGKEELVYGPGTRVAKILTPRDLKLEKEGDDD